MAEEAGNAGGGGTGGAEGNAAQSEQQNQGNQGSEQQQSEQSESLFDGDNEGGEAQSSGQQQAGDKKTDLILGKFKSQDDLAKAYENIEKVMKSRGDALDDDTLRTIAQERGMLSVVPEGNYEGYADIVGKLGIVPFEEGTEQHTALMHQLKDAGVTQDQLPKLAEIWAWNNEQIKQEIIAEYGPIIEERTHLTKLREDYQKEFGDKYDAEMTAIGKFARAQFGDAMAKHLGRNRESIEFVRKVQKAMSGSSPVRTEEASGANVEDLHAKMVGIIASDAYQRKDGPGGLAAHKRAHSDVDKILAALEKAGWQG